jgi:hypothetical protein
MAVTVIRTMAATRTATAIGSAQISMRIDAGQRGWAAVRLVLTAVRSQMDASSSLEPVGPRR